jgi:hypothetical protein
VVAGRNLTGFVVPSYDFHQIPLYDPLDTSFWKVHRMVLDCTMIEYEGGCQCGAGMPCQCSRPNGEDLPDTEVIVDFDVDPKSLH